MTRQKVGPLRPYNGSRCEPRPRHCQTLDDERAHAHVPSLLSPRKTRVKLSTIPARQSQSIVGVGAHLTRVASSQTQLARRVQAQVRPKQAYCVPQGHRCSMLQSDRWCALSRETRAGCLVLSLSEARAGNGQDAQATATHYNRTRTGLPPERTVEARAKTCSASDAVTTQAEPLRCLALATQEHKRSRLYEC